MGDEVRHAAPGKKKQSNKPKIELQFGMLYNFGQAGGAPRDLVVMGLRLPACGIAV